MPEEEQDDRTQALGGIGNLKVWCW